METNSISILGCGWLGFPLAKHLKQKGWTLKGSTTSKTKMTNLSNNGIKPYLINLNDYDTEISEDFFRSEYLLVNIPPSKVENTTKAFTNLSKQIQKHPELKVLYISSTSAYPNTNSIVKEEDTDSLNDNSNRTVHIERLFQSTLKNLSIIRLAGLVGPERHPGRFFSNGRLLSTPIAPVNIIHLDDCIGLIEHLLNHNNWGDTINGCSPSHPTKENFYRQASKLYGSDIITDISGDTTNEYKIVSHEKSLMLGYHYKYDDLMKMLDKKEAFK